jgi:uroporphyrin-III C-methyltransferase/precorrin-2 dehydrogenase/sirohydrochlorin ferrochelatase
VSAPLFPIFLRLEGRNVLVVGGGPVAAGRVRLLLESGARVKVVAPEVVPEIRASGVEVALRPFHPGDVAEAWLVVAAATPEVNRAVADAGEARSVFVNAVDDPASASAYTGGVVRRGGVLVAISTEGRAPALAGLLREAVSSLLPDDVGRWVEEAEALRFRQRADGVPMAARRPQLLTALDALYARPEAS